MTSSIIIVCMVLGASALRGIVFVMLDDAGASDISFNAKLNNVTARIPTSSIDRLADEGVKLSRNYVHMICAPSRTAFITSRYHTRLGNPFPATAGLGSLEPHFRTFVQDLSHRGFKNYFVGKWGIDSAFNKHKLFMADGAGPLERGFDKFFGLLVSGHNHMSKNVLFFQDNVDLHNWTRAEKRSYPHVDAEPDVHSTTMFTREAINFLNIHMESHSELPFFLEVSYTAPHDPVQSDPLHAAHPACKLLANARRAEYCGMIMGVDEGIRNITNALENHGILDDVVFAFVSDNGGEPMVGGYNYPFRGGKATIYEGGVRVPGFIRYPKEFTSTVYDGLFHITDWGPTFLSLADRASGTPMSHNLGKLDGIDMVQALRGGVMPRQSLLVHSDQIQNMSGIISRGGDWKLLIGATGSDKVVEEPTGVLMYPKSDVFLVIDQVNSFFLEAISPNFSAFQWGIHFLMIRIRDMFDLTFKSGLFINWEGFRLVQSTPLGNTVPLELPSLEWDSSLEKIYLFNLKEDPSESHNLAYEPEFRALVQELHDELLEILSDSPGQHFVIVRFFQRFIVGYVFFMSLMSICLSFVFYRIVKWLMLRIPGFRTSSKLKIA